MALKNPQRSAESGASGSSQWIATFARRWASGTTAEPAGNVARSRTATQRPKCPYSLSTLPARRIGNRPSNGRAGQRISESR